MTESGDGATVAGLVTEVFARYPVRLGVLFGSHARAESGRHSDIDVAVEFDQDLDESARRQTLLDLNTDLSRALQTDDIDVTDLDGVRPEVGASALADGVLLVGSPHRRRQRREAYRKQRPDRSREEVLNRFDELLSRIEEHA